MNTSNHFDMVNREKKTIIFFLLLLYFVIPFLEGNLIVTSLANFYNEISEFDTDTVMKILKTLIYLFSYANTFLGMFFRVVVLSAITLFAISMLEENSKITYKELILLFLAIELSVFVLKLLLLVGNYTYLLYSNESFQYFGTNFSILKIFNLNNSSIFNNLLLTKITINAIFIPLTIVFFLKMTTNIKLSNTFIVFVFIFLIYIIYEILNPLESIIFSKKI